MAKAIEDALAALQYKDANKTTPLPATGTCCNSHTSVHHSADRRHKQPALLVVLMLVSGSAVIGTAVVASKRRTTDN